MKLTIDSNIFVEAVTDGIHRRLCSDFLQAVYIGREIQVIEPGIFLFEFINAVDRAKGDPKKAKTRIEKAKIICDIFLKRDKITIWPINEETWRRWVLRRNKQHNNHKTQDELFLYTANRAGAQLVTLDEHILTKPSCAFGESKVVHPYDCLVKMK